MSAIGPPSGPPPGDGKPKLRPFSYGFWSPEVTRARKVYMKGMMMTACFIVIIMWVSLPVYWGSLAHQRSYPRRLHAFLINHDGGDIGNAIQEAVEAQIALDTHAKLGWEVVDPAMYPTEEDAINAVLDEKAWVIIVVHANSTQNLVAARSLGIASYNQTAVISAYYTQARNELASANFLVPYTEGLLNTATANFSVEYGRAFLEANGGNATAMAAVTKAPQTIANPVSYAMVNLRPYTATVATAVMLVGSIYIIIFSFIVSIGGFMVRAPLEPFLKTSELLKLRIIAPLTIYLPISLSYSMISLAFKAPFDAKYNHAAGFFLYWVYVYFTMCSVGLANEFVVQLITPRFMSYFIVPLIISNVSVGQLPLELEPWFYKYGYGYPVYNVVLATRTIIFNTKNKLGVNIAVLLAWTAFSICTQTALVLWKRRAVTRRPAPSPEAPPAPAAIQMPVLKTAPESSTTTMKDDASSRGGGDDK